jgi:5-methylcytosine-specific restriction endonuclease McrA
VTDIQSKNCKSCGAAKPITEYHRDRAQKDGRCHVCKDCNKAKATEWYRENPDKGKDTRRHNYLQNKQRRKEKQREYRLANKAKLQAAKKAWCEANREKKRELDLTWQRENRQKVLVYRKVSEHKRRAQKLKSGGSYTACEINKLMHKQRARCACCKTSIAAIYEIDHIMPLSKGGSNDIVNIQLLCPPCNRRKSAKHPIQFMQEMGFLL